MSFRIIMPRCSRWVIKKLPKSWNSFGSKAGCHLGSATYSKWVTVRISTVFKLLVHHDNILMLQEIYTARMRVVVCRGREQQNNLFDSFVNITWYHLASHPLHKVPRTQVSSCVLVGVAETWPLGNASANTSQMSTHATHDWTLPSQWQVATVDHFPGYAAASATHNQHATGAP